jgi:signal transduction histidine kinase
MRTRILSILLCGIVLFVALDFTVHRLILYRSYISLEKREASKDLTRCLEALQREVDHLDAVTHDWAAWDDTYRFVMDGNKEYIASNLVLDTFTGMEINLLYICNMEKEIVWGEVREPDTYNKIELQELSARNIKKIPGLFDADAPEAFISGVWVTSEFPMIVAARPVITSDNQGPVVGYLVMGRILTEEFVKAMSEQTQVSHTYEILKDGPPDYFPAYGESLAEASSFHFDPVNTELLRGYALFPDITGHPALLLRADLERSATIQGKAAIWYTIISVCSVGGILLVSTLLLLNHMVIRPLADLTANVMAFGNRQDLSFGNLSRRHDEIGLLCREFNNMVIQLQEVNHGFRESNILLAHEVGRHRKTGHELQVNQERLRALSSELVMIEERERRRLALDLHDRIGQALAVLRMQIELLLNQPVTIPENAEKIRTLIEQIIHDSRSLTFELSPPVLYELGLGAAIEWLADDIMQHNDIHIEVEDRLEVFFEDSVRAMLFRSIRELLYNVVKHAGAEHVWVRLYQTGGKIRLVVEDNGKGFNWEKHGRDLKNNTGFGLFSIQERSRQLGGDFDIRSREKGGCVVTLSLLLDSLTKGIPGEEL